MIILTGGAGFIGTNLLIELNNMGLKDILIVDNIGKSEKWININGKQFSDYVNKNEFWHWIDSNQQIEIDAIFHFGACSDTAEQNFDYLYTNNVVFSQKIWKLCSRKKIPLIYASSAATYGNGSNGYSDNIDDIENLKPINPYGMSKHIFDIWAIKQAEKPPSWFSLKLFNVYGPYEKHKSKMASVAFHGYNQINDNNKIRLFKSHKDQYKDGEQKRDFIYVHDVVKVALFLYKNKIKSGVYNVGTSQENTFNSLAENLFASCNKKPIIEYFDMPVSLKDSYQYQTKAEISRLRGLGYKDDFISLREGINDYVNFLKKQL